VPAVGIVGKCKKKKQEKTQSIISNTRVSVSSSRHSYKHYTVNNASQLSDSHIHSVIYKSDATSYDKLNTKDNTTQSREIVHDI